MYRYAAVAWKSQFNCNVHLLKPRKEVGIFAITPKARRSVSTHSEFFQLEQAESQNFALTTFHNKSSSILCSLGEASGWLSWT